MCHIGNSHSARLRPIVALLAIIVGASLASGQKYQVIQSFGTESVNARAGLVADGAGNLYGTTFSGGFCASGSLYELSPLPSDQWEYTILHTFCLGIYDIANPSGALTFDALGNLYGTTTQGIEVYPFSIVSPVRGVSPWEEEFPDPPGPGAAFKLSPPTTAGGTWTESIIFAFPAFSFSGGADPQGRPIFDAQGNLYMTAFGGGAGIGYPCAFGGCGAVFELTPPPPPSNSGWTQSVLYSFGHFLGDGLSTSPDLILRDGALFGTTEKGGTSSQGTVFELTESNGVWSEQVLHNFTFAEGGAPIGNLIFDAAGNIYGTTFTSDNPYCQYGCGAVFKLSPPEVTGDPWQETTLYSFTGGKDGGNPQGGLTQDANGDLFGTTLLGGTGNGVVFKLAAPKIPGANWKYLVLHTFAGAPNDGSGPVGKLLLIKGKGLYGVTSLGGADNNGTVFNLVP